MALLAPLSLSLWLFAGLGPAHLFSPGRFQLATSYLLNLVDPRELLAYRSTLFAGSAPGITVLPVFPLPAQVPPGAILNLPLRFTARSTVPGNYVLRLVLLDRDGSEVAQAKNDLMNGQTILPTSQWRGDITLLSSLTVPQLPDQELTLAVGLYSLSGPVQLTPAPGVAQDPQVRYIVGSFQVRAHASQPPPLQATTFDLTGYHLTFQEQFTSLSISNASLHDGSRWYARNEECCMTTTDGASTAMAPHTGPQSPFSLLPGGGLNIRLQRRGNAWTSGVLTSVDSVGNGFSQQYGYFEMKARFPPGINTWPAFWLLNTDARRGHAPTGEIDIVEYIANPAFRDYIATTLHDWSNGSTPAMSHYRIPLPTDGFHLYGMSWTGETMTFYVDGAITFQAPTPAIMHQSYYLLVDLGIGGGWPTEATPSTNDMQIAYIRAYSR